MRISFLALATFSALIITSDAEAMFGWLSRGKNSGNKQDTEMGILSSSVPRQKPDTHGSAHVSPPSAVFQRTVSADERREVNQNPFSGSVESHPLAIPKSAPGTPSFSRRAQHRDDAAHAQSFAPGTVLTGDNFIQFPMDSIGVQNGALMTPPSIPQPVPAQEEQYTLPEEGVFELEDLEDETAQSDKGSRHRDKLMTPKSAPQPVPTSTKQTTRPEGPEDERSQSGSPQDETSLAERFNALRTSSQSGNDLVVGSAPDRTPKYNRRKKE